MSDVKKPRGNLRITLMESKRRRVVPGVMYVATIKDIQEKSNEKFGDSWMIIYEFLNGCAEDAPDTKGSAKGITITKFINKPQVHPDGRIGITTRSALYDFLKKLGVDVSDIFKTDEDFTFDLASFIGKRVRLLITDTDRVDDNGSAFQKPELLGLYVPKK